jgi:transglycosylase-like protein/LysM domain-containing protein
LGRHSNPSRIWLPLGAAAAAPALAAAAFCLAPQAAVAATVPQAAGGHAAVLDAAFRPAHSAAPAKSHTRHARARSAGTSLPVSYKVRPGDSLASIAWHFYHDQAAWPAIYWRNHAHIRWADDISAGQVLRIPARPSHIPAAPAALQPAVVTAPVVSVPPSTTQDPAEAQEPQPVQQSAAVQQPVQSQQATAPAETSSSGGYPGGSFGQCVVSRESGGDAQVMNSSGHYGLYQFSASTWAEYGGSPAEFGNASVAQQNQVFSNALAAGGQSNWAPYDGC